MASKTFKPGTVIDSVWLNDVNKGIFTDLVNIWAKLNKIVSITDYGAKGNGVTNDTAAFAAAIADATGNGMELLIPPGDYVISSSIDLRNKGNFIMRGLGLPSITMTNNTAPIIMIGGERNKLDGLMLRYSVAPSSTQTDAVAIRCYNLYESIIERVYIYKTYGGIDQYQGLVNGGQNAFYSNSVRDIRIVYFAGWAIKLQPFQGGNSGNRFDNIYINNRSGTLASDSLPCLGGFWLQTSQDGVINQLNIEWLRNAGPAVVLNQCSNVLFNGLHFEGLYPTTNFNPLIDIPGGDSSMPMFNGLSVVGSDWGGGAGMGLFRMDNQGTKLYVNGLLSYNNRNLGGMAGLLINGGPTCYGSTIEVVNAACDGSFQTNEVGPRITAGTPVAGLPYPLIRYNGLCPAYSAIVSDDSTGTQTSGTMTGQVSSVSADPKSMWNQTESRFEARVSGNYLCTVNIPTGTNCTVYVLVNYVKVAALPLPPNGGSASVSVPLALGNNVEFYLADGSYTRTGVTFGVSII